MRIISLLPSATEILYFLGAGDRIVGVSEECDFPLQVKQKPIVSFCLINQDLPSKEIDEKVSRSLKFSQEISRVDEKLFASLKPDLVITQELCKVCAITPTDIQKVLHSINPKPEVLTLHPHSLAEILEDILRVGRAIGKEKEAVLRVKSLEFRVKNVQIKTAKIKNKPKVFCMEWLDPPYNGGHWVPEQVEIAGGKDDLSVKGIDSVRLIWQKIVNYNPEVLILMPCGFSIQRTKKELFVLTSRSEWKRLKAVQNDQVYLVNGPAYFNNSGPRAFKGIELLASIFHPDIFKSNFKRQDLEKVGKMM